MSLISLEALNSPLLVAIAGAAGVLGLPFIESLAADGVLSFAALKTANTACFAVQLVAVSIPGRIDGQVAEAMAEEKAGAKKGGAAEKLSISNRKEEKEEKPGKIFTPRNGRTLVSPAGWAFAIWGPIFLGEMAFVAAQFSVDETSELGPILRKVSVPFAMAQTFQTLWCAAFRPKYKGNLMYISSGLLSAVAYSLSRAHAAFSSVNKSGVASPHGIFFLPLAMHFGWTTAASLVNLNGALSMKESTSDGTIALAGHASAVVAAGLGVFVTLTRSAPTFGGVIAWALLACADGMRDRLDKAKKVREKKDEDGTLPYVGVHGAQTQFRLCRLGSLSSGAAAMFVAGRTYLSGRASKGAPP